MTQNEAINYLKSSGMSDEQINAISYAFNSKYREVMNYLITAEPDGYPLHKWTSEYGYVITVYDVIKAFCKIKEEIENEADNERFRSECIPAGHELHYSQG